MTEFFREVSSQESEEVEELKGWRRVRSQKRKRASAGGLAGGWRGRRLSASGREEAEEREDFGGRLD